MKYSLKATVEATQFLPPHEEMPSGVFQVVSNKQGAWVGSVRNTQGKIIYVYATNWVIQTSTPGRCVVLTDKVFRERYGSVEEGEAEFWKELNIEVDLRVDLIKELNEKYKITNR